MNPILSYIKAVIAAVGAIVFPPIFDWLVGYIPAPPTAHTAIVTLLVALATGGAVAGVPNAARTPKP